MCITHEQNWSNSARQFLFIKRMAAIRTQTWSVNTVRQDGLCLLLLMEAVTANQPTGHDSTV